jgi:DnaK suppressor protein
MAVFLVRRHFPTAARFCQDKAIVRPADQAASEYERQSLVHQAAAARQMLKNLTQALERMRQGTFGECAECGGDIELKRLEAIPWARYCVRCQEARERG